MRFSTVFRQIGHPSIWSPHIWHVPCPHRNTIFLIRSKHTGHIVYIINQKCIRLIESIIVHKNESNHYHHILCICMCTHLFFDVLKLLLQFLYVIQMNVVYIGICWIDAAGRIGWCCQYCIVHCHTDADAHFIYSNC